jgi:hypothetical protein
MAWYKHANLLKQVNFGDFDAVHQPGTKAPFAGIYRCAGCGHEIGIAMGHTLPPQGHHQHAEAQGAIRWVLAVFADHENK